MARSVCRWTAAPALATLAAAVVAVAPVAAAEPHTVDAVDLVTGAEDPAAIVALAVESLQVLAGAVAFLAVRSARTRFQGGVIARGLTVATGAVAVFLVGAGWHLASVVSPARPAPALVEQGYLALALLLFAVAAIDLYRSI